MTLQNNNPAFLHFNITKLSTATEKTTSGLEDKDCTMDTIDTMDTMDTIDTMDTMDTVDTMDTIDTVLLS